MRMSRVVGELCWSLICGSLGVSGFLFRHRLRRLTVFANALMSNEQRLLHSSNSF